MAAAVVAAVTQLAMAPMAAGTGQQEIQTLRPVRLTRAAAVVVHAMRALLAVTAAQVATVS